jgi:hypothetical protein
LRTPRKPSAAASSSGRRSASIRRSSSASTSATLAPHTDVRRLPSRREIAPPKRRAPSDVSAETPRTRRRESNGSRLDASAFGAPPVSAAVDRRGSPLGRSACARCAWTGKGDPAARARGQPAFSRTPAPDHRRTIGQTTSVPKFKSRTIASVSASIASIFRVDRIDLPRRSPASIPRIDHPHRSPVSLTRIDHPHRSPASIARPITRIRSPALASRHLHPVTRTPSLVIPSLVTRIPGTIGELLGSCPAGGQHLTVQPGHRRQSRRQPTDTAQQLCVHDAGAFRRRASVDGRAAIDVSAETLRTDHRQTLRRMGLRADGAPHDLVVLAWVLSRRLPPSFAKQPCPSMQRGRCFSCFGTRTRTMGRAHVGVIDRGV